MTYDLKPASSPPDGSAPLSGAAWKAAVEDHRRGLVRLAVKLVWNRDDAEDLVQEAFQLAVAKRMTPADERFGPWLYRTVSNLCLNHRRRRRAEPLGDWVAVADDVEPDARAQQVEQLTRLREAIGQLPDRQRLAITLRTLEQMDYPRIAEIMELSVSAVRAHVHFGRGRLAELMAVSESGAGR